MEEPKKSRTKPIKISLALCILGLLLCLWSFFIYPSIFYIFPGISFILLSFTAKKSKEFAWVALIMLCISIPVLPVYSFFKFNLFKVNLGRFTLEQFLILFALTIIIFLILYIISFIRLIKNLKYFLHSARYR